MGKSMRLLAGVTAAWFLAGGAQAQLSGEARSRFLAGFRPSCLRNLRNDERLAGVLNSTRVSLCSCAGPRIAATLDLSEASAMAARPAEEREAWMNEIGVEAVEYCIQRRGGFMPGMSVTPNH
jgi:hypothetical protein